MGMKVFASGVNFKAITKSDATIVNCKAIYVGTTGNIALSQSDSATAVTFVAVPAGFILPIELKNGRVMSTNTTASNMIALDW